MRFMNTLVLASSAASASVMRRATTAAAAVDDDIAAFFTGFSDAKCSTVNTEKKPVTFSKHDGTCIKLAKPAKSLKAVDAHPEVTNGDSPSENGTWYFYAFTTTDCDVSLPEAANSTALPVNDDTCHAAPTGETFKSILMYTEQEPAVAADDGEAALAAQEEAAIIAAQQEAAASAAEE